MRRQPHYRNVVSSSTFLGVVPVHPTFGKPHIANTELAHLFSDTFDHSYVAPVMNAAMDHKVFMRYNTYGCVYNQDILRKAQAWTRRRFFTHMQAPLSTHEEVIANMDFSTSPGYPYNQFYGSKAELIESHGSLWLQKAYDHFITKQPYAGVWKQSLKTELRPVGKDPRGILSDSMDQVYIKSRFFLGQNLGFYSSVFRTPSAVGISREHGEWHALYTALSVFDRGSDMDYRKFDSGMIRALLEGVRDLRKAAIPDYQAWARPMLDPLYESIIQSVTVLSSGDVWQKEGGNPSGSVNTVVDNTLVCDTLHNYAFIALNPGRSFEDMEKNVVHFVYGDDNTYTWSPDVNMDPDAIAKVVSATFGYTTTHGGIRHPRDLTFLSAGFKEWTTPWGSKRMVPSYDRTKMVHHVVSGPRTDSYSTFERLCSLKRLLCFDDYITTRIDQMLHKLKPEIPDSVWTSMYVTTADAQLAHVTPSN